MTQKKVYFRKEQNTSEKTITCFYYNKNKPGYDNIDFLVDKIDRLLKSPKSTDNIKKQLKRISGFNFGQYDCFYIYSNKLCFGIKTADKIIDYYDNDFDTVVKLPGYTCNYNCKLPRADADADADAEQDTIDASDFAPDAEQDADADAEQDAE